MQDSSRDPLLNPLLVSHIFSYLPIKDLLTCRRLSKLWDQEASRLIRKRYARSEVKTLFQTTAQIKEFTVVFRESPSRILKGGSFVFQGIPQSDSILTFVQQFHTHIRGLRITGNDLKYPVLNEILTLIDPHLEVLGITAKILDIPQDSSEIFHGCSFPLLRDLALDTGHPSIEYKVVQTGRKLQGIRIKSELWPILSNPDFRSHTFPQIRELFIGNSEDFLKLCYNSTLQGLHLVVLEVILKTHDPLTLFRQLAEFLDAQKDTLEVLKVCLSRYVNPQLATIELMSLFPSTLTLGALKSLTIVNLDLFHFRTGRIHYSKTLPSLQTLDIRFQNIPERFRGALRRILARDLFVPGQEAQMALKNLNLSVPETRNTEEKRLGPIIRGIFPNLAELKVNPVRERDRERGLYNFV